MYNDLRSKYKFTAHTPKNCNHNGQNLFTALNKFVSNCVYFSRFNDVFKGKYLNAIHNFLVSHSFYDNLYKKLLSEYLKLVGLKVLENLSVDSMFTRNILGKECNGRNPHYGNKTGLKPNFMVDELGTPVSIIIANGIDNDAPMLNNLIRNILVDKVSMQSIMTEKQITIIADSSYEGLLNNYIVTEKGYDINMGYNKRNQKKLMKISDAEEIYINNYKKRGIVENLIGHIQRYPSILNNYEKTIASYKGLLMFVLCIILSKKINKLYTYKQNEIKKKQNEEKINQERKRAEERKIIKINQLKLIRKEKEKEGMERTKERKIIENNVKKIISKNMSDKIHKLTNQYIFKCNIAEEINNEKQKIIVDNLNDQEKKYNMTKIQNIIKDIIPTNILMQRMLATLNNKEVLSIRDIIDINMFAGQNCDYKLLRKCIKDIETKTNKENKKKLSKFIFVYETIINFITNDIIYNNIYHISSYMFSKRKLFMVHMKANAFCGTNILNVLKTYNIESKIHSITDVLCNSKTYHSISFRLLKDCNLLSSNFLLKDDS